MFRVLYKPALGTASSCQTSPTSRDALTDLLKKNRDFHFDEQEVHAFELLKRALTSASILTQADPTKPYILRTDASDYALGVVLLQGEGPNEKPIEFVSRLPYLPPRNAAIAV